LDKWWLGPVLTVLGLGGFAVYSTWAAWQGANFYTISYLSPFYSPIIFAPPGASEEMLQHAWLGTWPEWWPSFVPASPAFLILIFPGAFRATCYYYRKAYYRSFFGSPAGCAVGARPEGNYQGETRLFLWQNLHRFALYAAIVFIFILYYDAFIAFFYKGKFGIGIGSIVLLVNATLLACYTFGCHSFRHLVGGCLNIFSNTAFNGLRLAIWKKVSFLNERHMMFAWISLFWVGFSDVYVRLVAMGVINDLNTWPNI
jgi:hypothetical protein